MNISTDWKFLIFILSLVASFSNPSHADPFLLDMVHHNPGEPKTVSAFTNPQTLAQWGYNGQVAPNFIESSVTFDSFDPEVFPQDSIERRWVVQQAQSIEDQITAAHAAGVKFYSFTDFIVLPKSLVKKYEDQILTDGKIDLHRPMTQTILRVLINEIFNRYPDLDGLMVRWGETYLVDVPYHTGGHPILRGVDSQVELINLLREEVCVKRNRQLFYRTWGRKFHTDPDYYLAVTNQVAVHPKLVFSIKYPKGDFHRMQMFNPTIGIGKHPQLIEVQCQPEAYGKCAHPFYIADGVINGWEELKYFSNPETLQSADNPTTTLKSITGLKDLPSHPNFAGIWTWSRGGGWKGPYLKNEFWCELNAYVISQWTINPTETEHEIFNRFARDSLHLQPVDVDRLRQICLLSAQGVLRGHMSMHVPMPQWWTRDEWIGGLDQLQDTINTIIENNLVEPVLAEKLEAAAIFARTEALARQLDIKDPELKEFIITSCAYGRIKYDIFAQGWTVMLLGQLGDRTGYYAKDRLAQAVSRYDQLWDEWKKLEKNSPSCPTLYYDFYPRYEKGIGMFPTNIGIGFSVDKYRHLIDI